jgi:hypothetical protein
MSKVTEAGSRPIGNHVSAKAAIDQVVSTFFSAFNNKDNHVADLECLNEIFTINGCLSKTCGEPVSTSTLVDFVAARHLLLNGGYLQQFSEREIWERTDIFGSVAHRLCVYEKSGILHGNFFETMGMKSIQLLRTEHGWKISSVAWDDERDGLSVADVMDEIRSNI